MATSSLPSEAHSQGDEDVATPFLFSSGGCAKRPPVSIESPRNAGGVGAGSPGLAEARGLPGIAVPNEPRTLNGLQAPLGVGVAIGIGIDGGSGSMPIPMPTPIPIPMRSAQKRGLPGDGAPNGRSLAPLPDRGPAAGTATELHGRTCRLACQGTRTAGTRPTANRRLARA